MKSAIQYAIDACDTLMRKFAAPDLPPRRQFHYHQGVFLSGMEKTWRLTGDEKYYEYIKAWVDSLLNPQGDITSYNPGQLDDLQPGVLLFPLLERTGDYTYSEAIHTVATHMKSFPRCENGGFWHKAWYHGQMWLDGLYMAGPYLAMYGAHTGDTDCFDLCAQQASIMRDVTKDERTGLWYHAWDSKKKCPWADPETGLAPEFWGRSIGWVPVAMLEEADYIPRDHPAWKTVTGIAVELLEAVARFQDEKTGLWYQVVDKPDGEGNWTEVSCSCLFACAIYKAVRLGLMDERYLDVARRGFKGVIGTVEYDENGIRIGKVCVGTGVGDYTHYINRPTSVNDLHGVGAFLLLCAEAAQD